MLVIVKMNNIVLDEAIKYFFKKCYKDKVAQ